MGKSLRDIFESSSGVTVDREGGVIKNVKVLGAKSRNGRTYLSECIDKAAGLYEGVNVNIDHPAEHEPDRERGIMEAFGVLQNVQRREDGLYGDLHYLKSHPSTPAIVERAERFPKSFGLSHNALGKTATRGSETVVEEIEKVRSVDLVTQPATTSGLFESVSPSQEGRMKVKIRDLLKRTPSKTPGRKLLEQMAEEPMPGEEEKTMAEMEADVPADAAPEEQIRAAFKQAIVAAIDDDTLDMTGTLAKIKEILKSMDKLGAMPGSEGAAATATEQEDEEAKPEGEVTESEEEEDKKVPESVRKAMRQMRATQKQLSEQVKRLAAEKADRELTDECREMLESSGRRVSDERVKMLKALGDDELREALIESWPEDARAGQRPDRSPPKSLRESARGYDELKGSRKLSEILR